MACLHLRATPLSPSSLAAPADKLCLREAPSIPHGLSFPEAALVLAAFSFRMVLLILEAGITQASGGEQDRSGEVKLTSLYARQAGAGLLPARNVLSASANVAFVDPLFSVFSAK